LPFLFKEEDVMAKKKVFVSFDYDNDKHYKYLLEAWDANPDFDFVFNDKTPGEINSSNIGRVKADLTSKIREATHTLFIVGECANQLHEDHRLIGFKNWMNFEAYQSHFANNKLAVLKLDKSHEVPEELTGKNYWWVAGFTEDNAIKVLNKV